MGAAREEGAIRRCFLQTRSVGTALNWRRFSAGTGVSLLLPFLSRFSGRVFPAVRGSGGAALLSGIGAGAGDFLVEHYLAGRGKASPAELP